MMKRRNHCLTIVGLLILTMGTLSACKPAEKAADKPMAPPVEVAPTTAPATAPAMATPTPAPAEDMQSQAKTAPALEIAEWLKGEPVTLADGLGESVYVVEFWATWCPPCLTSIPHLTEMQTKYAEKGVTFIGISAESDAKLVRDFVDKMGDKMAYTVALDSNRATDKAFNQPYGVNSIPHAYVVDKNGAIAWHGHPMQPDLEAILEKLVG